MPYSFHSHSGQFCKHGYGLLEDVVKEAIRKGFHTYGLSEHMPRYVDTELYPEEIDAQCTPKSLETTYHDFQVEAKRIRDVYKDKINLLIGAEIEFITPNYADHVEKLRQAHHIEYVIGSLHHVNSIPIDFSLDFFNQALTQIGGQLTQLYIRYFDEQYAMLQSVKPEIVGHFDLIRLFANQTVADATLLDPEVWKCLTRNLDYVIAYGGLFEINSRSWKKGLRDAYPQKDIIQAIQQKGGKFTLSDDCHGPNDVGLYYEKLPVYLKETGIDTLYYLANQNGKVVVKEHKDVLDDAFWSKIKDW
ncbi:polymerase/histidinol phosphatase-like protein [Gilbertella persicaria]|uniref:polymerase/histidinol phosphatase-like protein n=1 Tax=Gilbertella persicaria TaxID=101096 RepID=UPI002220FEFE|nr:polymerase/histidinol phosphatase-like protein [Gilbertella persicaria]KAI8066927.1 polymerase/histidinol phosphatase-like protein [Gilbertella persicaria]